MDADPGSTVPRRQLGRHLRQQREKSKITVKAAADYLECSTQKVWRIEKGAVPVRCADVKALCDFYTSPAEITDVLVGLARESKSKGWWHAYGDAIPEWFELYVGLEGSASRIRKYEPSLVPGLLQARAYMEAVILVDQAEMTDADVQRRVSVKQERQGLLVRHFPPPPQLEVIISEAALRSAIDTPGAMQQQLWHLLKANELPHVSVRVLPLAVGPHQASGSGAFTVLDFPADNGEKQEPTTIYSESLTGALYLDRPKEVEIYEQAWSDLTGLALSERNSGDRIRELIVEQGENR